MRRVIALVAILILFFSSVGESVAQGVVDELFPDVESGTIQKEYHKYPISHYRFDVDLGFTDFAGKTYNFILGLIFQVFVLWVRLTITMLEQAFTLDLIIVFSDKIDELVNLIKLSVWDTFLTAALAIAGVVILFNAGVFARRTRSWEQLFATFAVLLIALTFFLMPGRFLSGLNEISRAMSASILSSVTKIKDTRVSSIEHAVVVYGNELWKQTVQYPWYIIQFGSVSEGRVKESKFLPYHPSDKTRKDNTEEEAKTNSLMTEYGQIERYVLMVLFSINALVTLIVINAFSLLIIASQFVPLVLVALSSVVMLIALLPWFGPRTLQKFFERIFAAAFVKVVLSIFLSIFLLASLFFYTIFDGMPVLQLIVQLALTIAMIFQRKKIFGMFQAMPRGGRAVGEAAAESAQMGRKTATATKSAAQKVGRLALTAGLIMATGGAAAGAAAGAAGGKMGLLAGIATSRQKKKLHPTAIQYLNHRYLTEKQEAEEKAYLTGKDPEYSPFVKQVNANIERGLPLYTQAQQREAVEYLYDIKKQGGDVSRVFLPVGVQTNDPRQYHRNLMKYKEKQIKQYRQMNARRMARLQMLGVVSSYPNHPLDDEQVPANLSDVQRNFISSTVALRSGRTQRTGSSLSGDQLRKIEQASSLVKPREAAAKERKLTPMQQRFVEMSRQLKADRAEKKPVTIHRNDSNEKIAKAAGLAVPRAPVVSSSGSYSGASRPPVKPIVTKVAKEDLLMKELAQAERMGDTKRAQEIADQLDRMIGSSGSEEKRKMQPVSVRRPSRFSSVMVPVHVDPGQIKSTIDFEVQASGMAPAMYVHTLDEAKRDLYQKFKALDLYQQSEANKKIHIPDEYRSLAEQLMAETNKSASELSRRYESEYQKIKMKVDIAREHLQVQSKQMIEVNLENDQVEVPVVRKIKVRTPDEYYLKIQETPIDKLDFEVKNIDQEFRQSVINDWNLKSSLGVSPEEYLLELSREKQHQYSMWKSFEKRKGEKEFEELAARGRAIYVDAKKRQLVAEELLGIKLKNLRGRDARDE